ncbi:MAG: PEP-CTERM sorting domain-containing protein [Bryobacteraceae bacterium]|nr:PEP-CTERM sorting domain-containing protein [Bryobacteraceae bacterium]
MRSLSIFVLFAVSCSLASASIITQTCTPTNQDSVAGGIIVNAGTTTVSCAGFSAPIGSSITNISFNFLGTFSDSDGNNGLHQITFSGTTPYGTFGPFNTGSNGDVGSTGSQTGLSAAANIANTGAFNVSVTASNTVNTNALPESAQYTVRAVYTYEVNQSGVPEPSTLALVGGVLVLAGLRKFRS